MTRQTKKWNPGDAANAFVRGHPVRRGEHYWAGSRKPNGRRPWSGSMGGAHTRVRPGQALGDGAAERDHAIPLNRTHCGLHLFGNVVPSTKDANRQKAGNHYRQFLQDHDRIERIDALLRESRYKERIAAFGNLRQYCEAQYRAIDTLCRVNRQYLSSLLPASHEDDNTAGGSDKDRRATTERAGVLPIRLDPEPEAVFLKALLRHRRAWITEIHRDGSRQVQPWKADNMAPTSGVIANVRGRPRYRKDSWEPLGITSLVVSIRRPTERDWRLGRRPSTVTSTDARSGPNMSSWPPSRRRGAGVREEFKDFV